MIQLAVQPLKALLPKGKRYRKLLFGPAAGCIMALDFRHHLKAYLGLYEYELLPHLKRMIGPGVNCFDIGGRDGYDALMLAKLSRGKVASFECEHAAANEMRLTFSQNPTLSIQVVESSVGADDGDDHITIDRASRELFAPTFIKLDVEGAEDIALQGASETLATYRPHLIIEVHGADKEENCISILRRFRYEIRVVDQGTFLKDPARVGYNRWIAAYR
jgi:Methyltransferase FkbM domain